MSAFNVSYSFAITNDDFKCTNLEKYNYDILWRLLRFAAYNIMFVTYDIYRLIMIVGHDVYRHITLVAW